jgi:hypothetical protein
MFEEFLQGRIRFGWSGPSSDLRKLESKLKHERTVEEHAIWKNTQFLLKRIVSGDRVVLQLEQPLRKFLIGEVTEHGYDSSTPQYNDFNHFLHSQPLTQEFIPINAPYVPTSLKHDLSKRGRYYEIYPARSIGILDQLVDTQPWREVRSGTSRTKQDEFDECIDSVKARVVEEIRHRWPAQDFETFCAKLCERIDYVEVKELKDRHQGWDMILRINDPISGEELPGYGDVPAQCKNLTGSVTASRPIDDLVRCAKANLNCSVAYLFILGDLTDEFRANLEAARSAVQIEVGREIEFHVIEQDRIAELYLQYMAEPSLSAFAANG